MTKKEILEKYDFNQMQINKILSSYIIKKIGTLTVLKQQNRINH